ncbi:MAG: hypothetical protein MR541_05735, partial [Prevotella sp.]|nr:hypothetical protein [Prevotella sp.]
GILFYKYLLGQHEIVPSVYNSSMVLVILSIEIVYESKKCLVKSGKDKLKKGLKKYYVILAQVSRDTLQSNT